MFGRNPNAYPNFNQQPNNNFPNFSPQVFQQNNMFNFQFQNQIFNNYNTNDQQIPIITPNNYTTHQQNDIPNDENPNFDDILAESQQFSENFIAESSKTTYKSCMKAYKDIMRVFNKEPYPINIDNIKVFITYQAKQGIALNTLKSYINGISYYLRTQGLPNLTLTNEFKMFKLGLQRAFKEEKSPFAKLPFKIEYFIKILEVLDMNDINNIRMMFYMTLSFFAFLRISELISLHKKDIVYDAKLNKLIITIRYSKTDQKGKGITTYLYNNYKKIYHPLNFISFISNLNDNDLIVNITQDHLRKNLNEILIKIGLDKSKYSWHSFRRGGATLASINHIDPAVIKTHGRWLSEAYLLYVDRDQDNAGLQISDVL